MFSLKTPPLVQLLGGHMIQAKPNPSGQFLGATHHANLGQDGLKLQPGVSCGCGTEGSS